MKFFLGVSGGILGLIIILTALSTFVISSQEYKYMSKEERDLYDKEQLKYINDSLKKKDDKKNKKK